MAQIEKVRPTRAPAFAGVPVTLGDRQYLFPPLNFKSLKEFQPHIKALQEIRGTPGNDHLDQLIQVAHAAIARNYDNVSISDLEAWVDLGNFGEIFQAVLGVSGLKKVPPGEFVEAAPQP